MNRARGSRPHSDRAHRRSRTCLDRSGPAGGPDGRQGESVRRIERFFERLARRAKAVTGSGETKMSSVPASVTIAGREETAWQRT